MGRTPYTVTDGTGFGEPNPRLKPPPDLKEPEKTVFLDLVMACPATQFQASDLPLLRLWCELVVMAETAAGEMAATGMVADEKPSPWFGIYTQAVKALTGLAMRLRLGPQSRAFKGPKREVAPQSYYDRLRLAEGDDGDEEAEAETGRAQ
jgi:phage terminase small subunit